MAETEFDKPTAAKNDPWMPLSPSETSLPAAPIDPRYQLIDSDKYIASLENKLNRIKGGRSTRPLAGREMLKTLTEARQVHLNRLILDDVSSDGYMEDTIDGNSNIASLQRRLHPERQALTTEELQFLIDNDILSKVVNDLSDTGETVAGKPDEPPTTHSVPASVHNDKQFSGKDNDTDPDPNNRIADQNQSS